MTMALLSPFGSAPSMPAANAVMEKTTVTAPITASRRSAPRPGGSCKAWAVTDIGDSHKRGLALSRTETGPQSRHAGVGNRRRERPAVKWREPGRVAVLDSGNCADRCRPQRSHIARRVNRELIWPSHGPQSTIYRAAGHGQGRHSLQVAGHDHPQAHPGHGAAG